MNHSKNIEALRIAYLAACAAAVASWKGAPPCGDANTAAAEILADRAERRLNNAIEVGFAAYFCAAA